MSLPGANAFGAAGALAPKPPLEPPALVAVVRGALLLALLAKSASNEATAGGGAWVAAGAAAPPVAIAGPFWAATWAPIEGELVRIGALAKPMANSCDWGVMLL